MAFRQLGQPRNGTEAVPYRLPMLRRIMNVNYETLTLAAFRFYVGTQNPLKLKEKVGPRFRPAASETVRQPGQFNGRPLGRQILESLVFHAANRPVFESGNKPGAVRLLAVLLPFSIPVSFCRPALGAACSLLRLAGSSITIRLVPEAAQFCVLRNRHEHLVSRICGIASEHYRMLLVDFHPNGSAVRVC